MRKRNWFDKALDMIEKIFQAIFGVSSTIAVAAGIYLKTAASHDANRYGMKNPYKVHRYPELEEAISDTLDPEDEDVTDWIGEITEERCSPYQRHKVAKLAKTLFWDICCIRLYAGAIKDHSDLLEEEAIDRDEALSCCKRYRDEVAAAKAAAERVSVTIGTVLCKNYVDQLSMSKAIITNLYEDIKDYIGVANIGLRRMGIDPID